MRRRYNVYDFYICIGIGFNRCVWGCGVSDQEVIVGVMIVFVALAVASLFNSVLFGIYRNKKESMKPLTAIYRNLGDGIWVKVWVNNKSSQKPMTGIRKRVNGEWVTEWSESK